MLYHPPGAPNTLWDTWLFAESGTYYLFALTRETPESALWDSVRLATSADLVHWEDRGTILRKAPGVDWMGTGHTWKAGGRYVLNFSECTGNLQRIRFAVSDDLLQWTPLEDALEPDPRWYQAGHDGSTVAEPRWDCIYVVPAEDGDGFVGYLTATANFGSPARRGVAGMVVSDDGLHFAATRPATVPGLAAQVEVGGVAKVGDQWVMAVSLPHHLLGQRGAWPDGGVGTQYLVSPKQAGPFRLPPGNNRLLSAPRWWSYFGRFFAHEGRVFFNHHVIPAGGQDAIAFAPLKEVRPLVQGQVGLFYWPGNDALRGAPIPLGWDDFTPVHSGSVDPCAWTADDAGLHADARGAAGVAWHELGAVGWHGVIIDVDVATTAAAGLYLGPTDREGWALLRHGGAVEIGTLTRTGMGWHLDSLDTQPITARERHHLRLLARGSFAELYVDDRLIHAISMEHRFLGFGFIAEDGEATFSGLTVQQMTLPLVYE